MMNYLLILLIIFMVLIMNLGMNYWKFHPLYMCGVLIIYIILLCYYMNITLNYFWYSYIFFLVMVGGLMILFIYFTSLVGNQLFFFSGDMFYYYFFKLFIFMFFMFYWGWSMDFMKMIMSYMSELKLFWYQDNLLMKMIKNLNMDYLMDMNLYLIMYLFFTMICSVIICSKFMMSMRQLYK